MESESSRLYNLIESKQEGTTLDLSDMFLGDEACPALSRYLQVHSELETLDLKGNNLSKAGIEALESLGTSSIKSLNFQWNNLGAVGASEALARTLKDNRSLSEIDLRNNRIADAGAVVLSEMLLSLPSLKTVDLRWNHIKDASCLEELNATIELAGNPLKPKVEPINLAHLEKPFEVENSRFSTDRSSKYTFSIDSQSKSVTPMDQTLKKNNEEVRNLTKILAEASMYREVAEKEVNDLKEKCLLSELQVKDLREKVEILEKDKSDLEHEVKRSKNLVDKLVADHDFDIKQLELKAQEASEESNRLRQLINKETSRIRDECNLEVQELQEVHARNIEHKDAIIGTLKKERNAMDIEIRKLQCELMDLKIKHQGTVREYENKLVEDSHAAEKIIMEGKMKMLQEENIKHRTTIMELQDKLSFKP